MKYILLNGDVIQVDNEHVDDTRDIIAKYMNSTKELIQIIPDKNDDSVRYVFAHPPLPFLPWIAKNGIDYVDWCALSSNSNPKVADFLESHLDKVAWFQLNINPNPSCVDLLFRHPEHIDLKFLAMNPHPRAVEYVIECLSSCTSSHTSSHPSRKQIIQGMSRNTNPTSIDYLYNHVDPDDIEWLGLSSIKSPHIVKFLERYPDRIKWSTLGYNNCTEVVEFLLQNERNIRSTLWNLSSNTNDLAVEYLLQHPQDINFIQFSSNSNDKAVDALLTRYTDQIIWNTFAQNRNPRAIATVYENLHKISEDNKWKALFQQGEHGLPYWLSNLPLLREISHELFRYVLYSSTVLSKPYILDVLYEFRDEWCRQPKGFINWYCLFKNPGIFL